MKKFVKLCLSLLVVITSLSTLSHVAAEDKPFEGRTLNVVATSESYVPLFELFTEQTGAKVEFLSMSSGEVLSRAAAEGKPMADLWFGGGLDAFMQAKEDGLLEQYTPAGSDQLKPDFKDEDGYWIAKGITVVGFLINDEIIEEKGLTAPTTWVELTDTQYKDEIIMSNPAISGTNYAAIKGLLDLFGDEGWDYIDKLNENIMFYGKRGKDPVEKTSAGEFAIGIIPVDQSAFNLAEEQGLSVVYPQDGLPWVPEGVAIFKDSDNVDVAKAFEDFLLTEVAQKLVAEIDGKDTAQLAVEGIEALSLGLPADKLIKQDLSTFGSMREDILQRFEAIAQDKINADE